MTNLKPIRLSFVLLSVCALFALLGTASLAVSKNGEPSAPANVRITPPAPVFEDKERLAELMQRRERVAQTIGPQSFLVMFSTEPRVYANDVDYPYRQENNLYYLTNLKQKGATLVLLPGNTKIREILFMPRRDARAETWTGHMYSAEPEAKRRDAGPAAGQHENPRDPLHAASRRASRNVDRAHVQRRRSEPAFGHSRDLVGERV